MHSTTISAYSLMIMPRGTLKSSIIYNAQDIIFFDSLCLLCSGFVQFIIKFDKTKSFRFVALQSKEAAELLNNASLPNDYSTVYYLANQKILSKSDAVLAIVNKLRFPFSLLSVFKTIPKPIRDKLYNFVARNRSIFNKKACLISK